MEHMYIPVIKKEDLDQLVRDMQVIQCMDQGEDGWCGKKADTGQDDDIGFHRDKQGITDSLPCSLNGAYCKKCMAGVSKGEEKPKEEDETVYYKKPAKQPLQV